MSRKIPGCGCPGHPGTQIVISDQQATGGTKLNSGPSSRVPQIPEWVPPSLKKTPVGITERSSDSHPIPVVDSFEKANRIYTTKLIWRGSPPPRPRSNGRTGMRKKDASLSPVATSAERQWRQSFAPSKLMERDTRAETWDAACSKFHDDSLGRTTPMNSQTTTGPSKADDSVSADRHNALNWLKKKRDLFPCRDSPRPQESLPDSRRAEQDFQRCGDLEGHGDTVSWKNLSPVERRHEESRLYEKMLFASQHSNSKLRAEGMGGLSLRV